MSDATPDTAATVLPTGTQDFSDNEIMDGFGDGPMESPADAPLGLGREQPEPASPDMNTTPGVETPPDDAVSEPGPVPEPADEGGTEPQPPAEPELPEFPPMLLQAAGYATAEQARQEGFDDPKALYAAVQRENRSLTSKAAQGGSLYSPQVPQETPPKQAPPKDEAVGIEPFKPANAESLDEELLAALQQQDEHYAKRFQQQEERLQRQQDDFASELKERDSKSQTLQQRDYEIQFDQAVQDLGEDWQEEFGKGDAQGLDLAAKQGDPAAMVACEYRVRLYSAVADVRDEREEQGRAPLTFEQEVQRGLMRLRPEKYQEQFTQQLRQTSKAKNRPGVQASRPTARKTPLGTKTDQTLAALSDKYPGMGFDQVDEDFGEI